MNDFLEIIDYYYDHPVAFFEEVLGMIPDDWQKKVLNDLVVYPKISVRSGQGVGKTALEAGAIIWFLVCRPYSRVIATAPTMQQLYDVLWAEIAKWLNDSLVMDEASGVADPIMEAILGTLSGKENRLLMCGNPNRLEGVFYDSHNVDRDKFRVHKVSSMDSKRTSKDNIEMLLKKYGQDSDVARVRIFGEFPKGALDSLISMETVELACDNSIEESEITASNVLHIGCDVARFGDDKTVITPRIAGKIFPFTKYSKKSTMETAGNVILTCKEYMQKYPKLKRCIIKIDDTGVGGGVTDRLKEVVAEERLPYVVVPVNNGSAATDDYYANLGSQIWGELRDALEENFSCMMQEEESKPIIELPYDDEMIKQLSNRRKKITSKGKIQLESKDDMKKRGVGSPDVADSITLAFYEPKTWLY